MKHIPIAAAQHVAEQYQYDQVIIIARKVGDEGGGEHVTTYGVDKANCDVAARIGNFLKHKVMGWPEQPPHVRCASCDNGVRDSWTYCPYCGSQSRAEKD